MNVKGGGFMKSLYKFTDKELEVLADSMVILIDNEEKDNECIVKYFEKHKIKYQVKKLKYGGYSCYIPKNSELEIPKDMDFSRTITIDRVKSLEDLSSNFTINRKISEDKYISAHNSRCKVHLMVEKGSYEAILRHEYDTKFEPKSFSATLKSFEARYELNTIFLTKITAGDFIYCTLKQYIKEYFKGNIEL